MLVSLQGQNIKNKTPPKIMSSPPLLSCSFPYSPRIHSSSYFFPSLSLSPSLSPFPSPSLSPSPSPSPFQLITEKLDEGSLQITPSGIYQINSNQKVTRIVVVHSCMDGPPTSSTTRSMSISSELDCRTTPTLAYESSKRSFAEPIIENRSDTPRSMKLKWGKRKRVDEPSHSSTVTATATDTDAAANAAAAAAADADLVSLLEEIFDDLPPSPSPSPSFCL